jgi:hypothetical protein
VWALVVHCGVGMFQRVSTDGFGLLPQFTVLVNS